MITIFLYLTLRKRLTIASTSQSGAHYIFYQHKTDIEYVLDEEHIAFFTLRVSHFIFSSKSLHVAMVIQVHEVRNICLSMLIMASLYESPGSSTHALQTLKPMKAFSVTGLTWILQFWLNATFEIAMQFKVPNDYIKRVQNRQVEGIKLVLLTSLDLGLKTKELLIKYFKLFANCHIFTHSMAPFSLSHVPE